MHDFMGEPSPERSGRAGGDGLDEGRYRPTKGSRTPHASTLRFKTDSAGMLVQIPHEFFGRGERQKAQQGRACLQHSGGVALTPDEAAQGFHMPAAVLTASPDSVMF